MKITSYITLLAAAALLAAGCQTKLQLDGEMPGGESTLCFLPSLGGGSSTKSDSGKLGSAAAGVTDLVATDGSISIPMTCEVSEGITVQDFMGESAPLTKGEQMNTGEDWDELGNYVDGFYVAAWKGSASFVPVDTEVTKGNPLWKTSGSYIWKATEEATFYAYANTPESGSTVTATQAGQILSHTVPADASEQTDILMGYYSGKGVFSETFHKGGIAEVKFYHPLTAVRFKVGTFIDAESVRIKSIRISGVHKGGISVMTPTTVGETDSGWKFNWNILPTGTQTVTMNPDSGDALTVSADGLIDGSFLLIPQTMTADKPVKISIITVIDGAEKRFEAKLTDNIWEAGKTNTYRISYFGSAKYDFKLKGGVSSKAIEVADNLDTGNDKTITIPVTSTKTDDGGSPVDWDWTISTVKAGDGVEVPYNDGDKVCGLEFEKSGGNLIVEATHRTSVDPSTHSYWINDNGRTDNLDWTPDPLSRTGVTDLSKFNFMTEGSQAMNTANCYIIRRAGTYKLPLVYGNGIVNGAENVQAYAPVMATGGTACFLSPFVNHTGAGITSAFIENNTGCTAMSAGIIWQDRAKVVKALSISIVDGESPHTAGTDYTAGDVRYLQFEIDENTICQNNAIIAIYDGPDCTGNVIWSWHIWTTNSPALLQNAIPVTNYDGNEYDFFPITNLGWIDWLFFPAEEDVTVKLVQNTTGSALEVTVKQPERSMKSTGCWYQFGRKDPICNRPSVHYFSGVPADGTFNPYGEGPVGLDAAIRTPGTFYTRSSEYKNWVDTPYNNLWTGKFCKAGQDDQNDDMIKTIYDPSPVGYKVPSTKAFTGFTKNGSNASDIDGINKEGDFMNGWNLYTKPGGQGPTIFFAASSQRYYLTGDATGSPDYGMYWSANPFDAGEAAQNAYYLYIQPTKLLPVCYQGRAYGFSVRPVIDPTMPDNPME